MRTDVPRARLTGFLLAAVAALGLFLFLNSTFGGPTLIPTGGSSYELRASFPDSQNLVKNSLVMYRGFQVGLVDGVSIVDARAQVSFHLFPRYAPLPRGTIAQVDHRTFLQEPFVNIFPGRMSAPKLRSGATVASIPTVEPDDALQVFDPQTRRLLDQGTQSLARGLAAPDAGDEVNGTIAGLDRVLIGINRLVTTLQGQDGQLTTLVGSSATVLDAIAAQQSQLAGLIGSGRVVADTFAAQSGALGAGIDELNDLLATAKTVLPQIRPLLAAAPPVLAQVASTAQVLTPALQALRAAVHDALATADALGPSARAAVPALRHATAAERYLRPLVTRLRPLVANLVPTLGWVRARLSGIEAFIANDADAMDHGDSVGPWLQGFLEVSNASLTGGNAGCDSAVGLCVNPYPKPGDASDPQPYAAGDFPHLEPYFPR